MAKRTHDVVATIGKYVKDGEEKKRYLTVGSAFTSENGSISIKLDAVPVSPEWSGFLSLYPVKQQEQVSRQERQHTQAKSNGYQPQPDDDIPF